MAREFVDYVRLIEYLAQGNIRARSVLLQWAYENRGKSEVPVVLDELRYLKFGGSDIAELFFTDDNDRNHENWQSIAFRRLS